MKSAEQERRKPRIPDGVRVYAMSDIHGRADLLQQMFTVIDRDLLTSRAIRPIQVFLGDYIDRGPDSFATIELLIDRARRHECVFLKGNHEVILFEALANPPVLEAWRRFGGLQTMISYGLQPSLKPDENEQLRLMQELYARIPELHRRFYQNLRTSYTCGDFFFVHAGIKPGVPLDQQRDEDLYWIRDEFLLSEEVFEKYIVHGHTPVSAPDIRPNRANIDTGAYATGNLALLSVQGEQFLVV